MPRKPDVERIAAILAYLKEHGIPKTCRRFKLSRSTLWRLRQRREANPALNEAATRAEQKVQADWLTEARAARSKILKRVIELAEKSENLREAAGALKIVSDSALAYEVVQPDGGRTGDGAVVAHEGEAAAGARSGSPAGSNVH